jgi:hypothetical protein
VLSARYDLRKKKHLNIERGRTNGQQSDRRDEYMDCSNNERLMREAVGAFEHSVLMLLTFEFSVPVPFR